MIIQRKDYIDKINPFINKHIIKVLIGTRRSGKSTILKQIIDSLIKQGIPEDNIVWINFELSDYFEIDNIKKILKAKFIYFLMRYRLFPNGKN